MQVGIGQIDSLTGAFDRNAESIVRQIERARGQGCDLAVFPEFAVPGPLTLDLVWRPDFVEGCERAVERIRRSVRGIAVIVGSVARSESKDATARLRDCAYVIEDASIIARIDAVHVPPLGAAEAGRYFTSGPGAEIVEFGGRKLGVTVGEMIVPEAEPIDVLASLGAELVVHVGASPFHVGRDRARRRLVADCARENGVGILFANAVGAVDGTVFDGGSFVVDSTGELVFHAPRFTDGLFVVDVDAAKPITPPDEDEISDVREAIVRGIRDYVRKNGFSSVIVGLSGGADSSLVAALAVEALGPSAVTGVYLPCEHSTRESALHARELASRLNVELLEIPATGVHSALKDALPFGTDGIVDENLQARARATLWMALANERNALVLATGNKSEIAVGYCTLYGDTTGALAPIADLYKTEVYRLAASFGDLIPEAILAKAPSAELRPNHRDEDDLPPYDVLDAVLRALVDENASRAQLVELGFGEDLVNEVLRRFYASEYKRRQLPPGIALSSRPLGARHVPLTHAYRD